MLQRKSTPMRNRVRLLTLLLLLVTPIAAAAPPARAAQTPESESALLLFIDVNTGELIRFNPKAGKGEVLSSLADVVAFRLSPAGDRVAYGAKNSQWRIKDLNTSQEIDLGELDAAPVWSPDGSLIHRHTADDQSAVVDVAGNVRQLPYSARGEVKWSSDGRYLAFSYESGFWVATLDGPPERIAENIFGFEWSPTASLLAFNSVGTAMPITDRTPDGRRSYVFDPATGQTLPVGLAGGIAGWSPDGRKVLIERLDIAGASGSGFTLQAANPFDGKTIDVGSTHTDLFAQSSPAKDAWIVGRWQIRPDLSGVDAITDIGEPISWTPDGNQALLLRGGWLDPERQLHYFDRRTGASRLLISQFGMLPHSATPGIRAVISPGGTWAATIMTDREANKTSMLIATGDSSHQDISPMRPVSFSPDERWLIGRNLEDSWLLYDTKTGQERLLGKANPYEEPLWLRRPSPVKITFPLANRHLRTCDIDVRGTSELVGQVEIKIMTRLRGAPAGNLTESARLGPVPTRPDGSWKTDDVELPLGEHFLSATLLHDGVASTPSPTVRVPCGAPIAEFLGPVDGMPPDTSKGSSIAFRFDAPMDLSSMDKFSVHLYSDGLEVVPGKVEAVPGADENAPVYVFQPDEPLAQATYYALILEPGIRVAPPDDDVTFDGAAWTFRTTGVERDRLVEAIQSLDKAAHAKIRADVETVARRTTDIYYIKQDLERAKFGQAVLALISVCAKGPRSLSELVRKAQQYPPMSIHVLAEFSALALSAHLSAEDISAPERSANSNAWRQMGLLEAQIPIYEAAIKKSGNPNIPVTELEMLLLGAGRDSPMQIPVGVNTRAGYQYGSVVTGTSKVTARIHARATEAINRLPDPLPPDFPSEDIYRELTRARTALTTSQSNEVWLPHVQPVYDQATGGWRTHVTTARLGLIGRDTRLTQSWLKDMETRNWIEVRLTIFDALTTSVAFLTQTVGSPGWQRLDWQLARLEPYDLGLNALLSLSVDPRDLVVQVPVLMLNDLPAEVSDTHRVVIDILDSIDVYAQGEVAAAPSRPTVLENWLGPTIAYAAEDETPAITVTAMEVDEVTQPDGKIAAMGTGRCTIKNQSAQPQEVRARIRALPLDLQVDGAAPLLGRGWESAPVTLAPGQEQTLDFAFDVVKPPSGQAIDVVVMVDLDAASPGGWPESVGPFTQITRAGTVAEKAAELPLRSEPLLAGELGAGEVQTATLVLPASSPTTPSLAISFDPAMQLDLEIFDEAGQPIAFEVPGNPEPILSGPGLRQVVLPPGTHGNLTVAVRGVVSGRGSGLRYAVTAVGVGQERGNGKALAAADQTPSKAQDAAPEPAAGGELSPKPPPAQAPASPTTAGLAVATVLPWLAFAGLAVLLAGTATGLHWGIRRRRSKPRAWLHLHGHPDVLLRKTLAIGRSESNDLVLTGSLVSRRHARIVRQGDAYVIEDLDSTAGTFVNHRRVTRADLHDGDEIGIGETLMVFRVPMRGVLPDA